MNTNTVPGVAADDVLWTVVEVAAYLRVSRSWVYHRLESGLLPHLRVGGLVRFEPKQIRECASSLAMTPSSTSGSGRVRSIR